MPYTLAQAVHSDLLIKKSRFIGCVQPVADRAQAQTIVQRLRSEHPSANHVCWALLAGGQSAAVDDGEPSGTAGRPMLDVLRHQQLEGALATVVRYFGGVKLGAGGLVRAYTDAIAQALLQAEKVERQAMACLQCSIPYALEGTLRREITQAQAQLLAIELASQVVATIELPASAAPAFIDRMNDLAQGRIGWIDIPHLL
jgi:uncharacterized YigZ family protein